MALNLPEQRHDAPHRLVHVRHPTPVRLETQADLQAYFDAIVGFWQRHCAGQKVYYLIDWTNFSTSLTENSYYAEQVRRVRDGCALALVRYGARSMQKIAGRLAAAKLHTDPNFCETLEEALARLAELKRAE